MKTKILLPMIIACALLLFACQPAVPVKEAPAPQQNSSYPYPIPYPVYASPGPADNNAPLTSGGSLYPGVADGQEVTWEQAVAMIQNGEVVEVSQAGGLKLFITLKDGRVVTLQQPVENALLEVIKACGEGCKDIVVKSE